MNIKQKLNDLKNKARENAPAIIVTGSFVTAAIATVAFVIANEDKKAYKKAFADMNAYYSSFFDTIDGGEKLLLTDETKDEVLGGSKDVWFDVDGNRFDVTLHPED